MVSIDPWSYGLSAGLVGCCFGGAPGLESCQVDQYIENAYALSCSHANFCKHGTVLGYPRNLFPETEKKYQVFSYQLRGTSRCSIGEILKSAMQHYFSVHSRLLGTT